MIEGATVTASRAGKKKAKEKIYKLRGMTPAELKLRSLRRHCSGGVGVSELRGGTPWDSDLQGRNTGWLVLVSLSQ